MGLSRRSFPKILKSRHSGLVPQGPHSNGKWVSIRPASGAQSSILPSAISQAEVAIRKNPDGSSSARDYKLQVIKRKTPSDRIQAKDPKRMISSDRSQTRKVKRTFPGEQKTSGESKAKLHKRQIPGDSLVAIWDQRPDHPAFLGDFFL